MNGDGDDPKGLIREAYRIPDITAPECRSIFMDWALSQPGGTDPRVSIRALLDRYGAEFPDHPMTLVLREGMAETRPPARRGGWRGRRDGAFED